MDINNLNNFIITEKNILQKKKMNIKLKIVKQGSVK